MNEFSHERLDVYQAAVRMACRERAALARALLWRIVAMLTAMALRFRDSGAEAEAGQKCG
jgi:hypothetical protein